MDFELSVDQVSYMLSQVDDDSQLKRQLSANDMTNSRMLVPDHIFDAKTLDQLWEAAEETGDKALKFQLVGLRNIRYGAGHDLVVDKIEDLANELLRYFATEAIDGWIYRRNKDGALLPWLIDSITYTPREEGMPGLPFVSIQLLANTMASTSVIDEGAPDQWRTGMTSAILFYQREMGDLPIPELLARKGYFKECPEFKADYEEQAALFNEYQSDYGKQFTAKDSGFLISEGSSTLFKRLDYFRIPKGTTIKCVNDEEVIERRIETYSNRFKQGKGRIAGRIPVHCYLHMFHLELHQNCWVHVQNLEPYKYNPSLKDKLILPPEHRRLIDILTAHMEVMMDDIIEGKSGGTTILCMGAAGLGKTLTAEVYSEVVGKPLYRVHSGQLGITAESVQVALSDILQRAARWDSIMLIDEADVYIRQRDNDLQHNAIVAEFLRTLEYFNGLLFMTTNRTDDVDDAILSRCIAVIRYQTPSREDAFKLWRSLADQFKIELSDDMVHQLVSEFPNSSGRDIKELLKLTGRLCTSCDMPISMEAFHQCAVFRGRKHN